MANTSAVYARIDNGLKESAELDAELKKGMDSLGSGSYTADEVDTLLAKEFGI